MKLLLRIFLVIGVFSISACGPFMGLGEQIPVETVTSQEPTITPTVESSTPVQGIAGFGAWSASGDDPPTPTPALDPLVFEFPEAEPAPVSAWRPALYPIPWAPTPNDHFYFSRPIAADEVNWPLANYRYGGVFFPGEIHTGVDIPAPPGTPVLAAGDGKVIWANYGLYRRVPGDTSDPYGKSVMIQHDFGHKGERLYTVYGHLQEIFVPRGQYVKTGDILGLVGETGRVTGPHLHMEIRWGKQTFFDTVNPELWLVPPQGWGILAARIMDSRGGFLHNQELWITSVYTGQMWQAFTYGDGPVNRDEYYQENIVISDLPAGLYQLDTSFAGKPYTTTFKIFSGRVSFLSFRGANGFNLSRPEAIGHDFTPHQADETILDN